jgi:hypothetical protein
MITYIYLDSCTYVGRIKSHNMYTPRFMPEYDTNLTDGGVPLFLWKNCKNARAVWGYHMLIAKITRSRQLTSPLPIDRKPLAAFKAKTKKVPASL